LETAKEQHADEDQDQQSRLSKKNLELAELKQKLVEALSENARLTAQLKAADRERQFQLLSADSQERANVEPELNAVRRSLAEAQAQNKQLSVENDDLCSDIETVKLDLAQDRESIESVIAEQRKQITELPLEVEHAKSLEEEVGHLRTTSKQMNDQFEQSISEL
jgi:hypothetical protein